MTALQDNHLTETVACGGNGATARPLRRDAAAEYVREKFGFPCSTQWLAKLAVIGGGPIYVKAGRFPMYQPSDLDAWARSRMSAPKRSTSDAAA